MALSKDAHCHCCTYCSAGLRHPYDAACTPQATLLAEKHGLNVCIIDPNLEKRWIPNYGVWVEEWEALDKDLQVHEFPRVLYREGATGGGVGGREGGWV